jgi:hypothetical protein
MRFPRFTGRWRDDKAAEDATTTRELAELFLTARRARAGDQRASSPRPLGLAAPQAHGQETFLYEYRNVSCAYQSLLQE